MRWPTLKIDQIKANCQYALVGGPFGSNLTTRDYVQEGIPVVRGVNLPGEKAFSEEEFVFVSERKADELLPNNAFPGDVIFTQRGTLGQVGIIPKSAKYDRYVISQSQMKLTVDPKKADSRFVYYFFRHPETIQRIKNQTLTSGVPHINLGILKNFNMPLPPLQNQQRIVNYLAGYDDLIENNLRRVALIEDSARLLYREWFVHLRFPGYGRSKIINGVPEGWERKTLVELAELRMGQSPESKFYNSAGEGLPFHQGVSDFGERFVSNSTYCTASNRVAEAGDILCSVRAPVGRLNITLDKIIIGRGLAALRSRAGHQSFLYYQLKNHFFKEDLIGGGTIFAAVTKKELESVELLSPPLKLIQQFEDFSNPIDRQLANVFFQNQKLKLARNLLLPKLMSGQITV